MLLEKDRIRIRGELLHEMVGVELRMDLISDVLQHEDYQAVSERMVSGVEHPANRAGVDMSFAGGNTIRDVGFTVVQASAGRWLVSLIELEKSLGGERAGVLYQLDQSATRGHGVEEGYLVPTGAGTWLLVDDLEPARLQIFEGCGDIADPVADVM